MKLLSFRQIKLATFAAAGIICSGAFATDYFWENRQTPKTIYNQITAREGMDMQSFHEMFSRTTSDLRREYINEARSLLRAGATGAEAMQMVLSFDDRVYDRRVIAKRGTGETLARYVKAGFEAFYRKHQSEGGKRLLDFSPSENSKYSINLTWGVRPTVSGKTGLYVSAEMTNEDTMVSRTFTSRGPIGSIDRVGQAIAFQIVHGLHKTSFPLSTRLNGNRITVYNPTSYTPPSQTQWRTYKKLADQDCRSRGLRLIKEREITELFSRGIYHGGATQGKSNWVFDNGHLDPRSRPNIHWSNAWENMPYPNRTVKHFCVGDGNGPGQY